MSFPTVTVEAGFALGASTSTYLTLDDPARGKLDVATLAPDVVWTDISAYLRSFWCRRGASRVDGPVLHWEAGAASIELDDSDRRFDPNNLAGPYVSGGATQVKPLVAIRIRATFGGVTYDVWRGFAESWQSKYMGPNLTVCTLTAADATKPLAAAIRSAVAPAGASEDTGARVNRVLDSASWPSVDRVVATGDSTLQATTLDGAAWTELQLATDSEIGELYNDAAGRVVFRNRQAVVEDTRSNTSQVTFGDGGGSELPYRDVTLDYSDQQLINTARITRAGGTEQVVQDATSQSEFLVHTFERSDVLLETDGAAADYAGWVVSQAKDPELRFTELIVDGRDPDPATEALKFAQILSREIGDRITGRRRPPGGGALIERDVLIRGVRHECPGDLTWTTTWALQSGTRLQFLVLDHPTLGALDTNALGF